MNADREYLYGLVDKIPEEKLEELRLILLKMAIPEVEPTPEEIEAIKTAREQIARGEYVSFNSIEDMKAYFLNDDEKKA